MGGKIARSGGNNRNAKRKTSRKKWFISKIHGIRRGGEIGKTEEGAKKKKGWHGGQKDKREHDGCREG